MPGDVRQALLRNPVEAQLDVGGEPVVHPVLEQVGPNAGPLREALKLQVERGGQADVIQQRRVQQVGEVPDALERPVGNRPHAVERFIRADLPVQRPLGDRQLELDRRQGLPDLIVQLARDRAAFLFLRVHQLRGQPPQVPRLLEIPGSLALDPPLEQADVRGHEQRDADAQDERHACVIQIRRRIAA